MLISDADKQSLIAEAVNANQQNIKLSQEEVDEILHLYFSGEVTNQSELARMYGLSQSSIRRLIQLELILRH